MTLHPTSENRFLLTTAMEKSGDVVGAVAIHKEIIQRYPTFGRVALCAAEDIRSQEKLEISAEANPDGRGM